ncbi:hypothetical protein H4218_004641 [Coemansia sp. IMI 209128]|nr:hypothetical protein H4218_004641 [Coemansia sp. IMI 209128]
MRHIIITVPLSLSILPIGIDVSIVTTVIPKIAHEFNALSSAAWIAPAYMVTLTALQPLFGRLSDIFGRATSLIGSILLFTAGSAAAGWAKSMSGLIFGRALQGVGGADIWGSLVLIGGVTMLLLALNWGGKDCAWSSARIICLLAFSCVLLGLFLVIEWKVAKQPAIPIELFRIRNVSLVVVGQLLMGAAMYSPIFFVPTWHASVKNASNIAAGLHLIPYLASCPFSSLVAGVLVKKIGGYRKFIVLGLAMLLVGSGLMILMDENTSTGKEVAFLLLMGIGIGLSIQLPLMVAQKSSSAKDLAATTSLYTFMRILGYSMGVAILQSTQTSKTILDTANDQTKIYSPDLPDALRVLLVHDFSRALHKVFIATVPFAAIAFILALPIDYTVMKPDKASENDNE